MRGITGAADSLAQGIREWKKNKEESAGFDTLIEGAVRADPTLAEKYGDQLAKAPGMSLSQKKSLAGTLALETQNKRLAQEQQIKEQDFNLRKAYFNLQQGAQNRATERDLAGQRFTETLAGLATAGGAPSMDFANTMAGEPMPARELGLADIVQAAGQSGLAMEPASLAQLIRAEQMGQRQARPEWGGPSITTLTNPVTGERVPVFQGGPNQASLMPDNELSPQGKQRAIDQLLARRTQLAVSLANSMATEEDKAPLRQLMDELNGRLAELTGKPVTPRTGADGNGDPVEMTNPQGQRVRVPANRVDEAKKKGYK